MGVSMNDDDARLTRAISEAPDQVTAAARIRDYYRDLDRADRTPRKILYLHLGMLSGILDTWRQRLRDIYTC
jgi:hypothetical protein